MGSQYDTDGKNTSYTYKAAGQAAKTVYVNE